MEVAMVIEMQMHMSMSFRKKTPAQYISLALLSASSPTVSRSLRLKKDTPPRLLRL
jgi:hypothetical protein